MSTFLKKYLTDTKAYKPKWAAFDSPWYLARYRLPKSTNAFRHYLDHGIKNGHSPNMYFDEQWYMSANKSAVDEVKSTESSCGFEHYIRFGQKTHSPHWLFDLSWYRFANKEISESYIYSLGMANHYDYFLSIGDKDYQSPHPLFDPSFLYHHCSASGLSPFQLYISYIGKHKTSYIKSSLFF